MTGARCVRWPLTTLEPKAEAVAYPAQNLYSLVRLVEEDGKYGIEGRFFYVQLDKGREVVDGFSEVDRFGVDIHFLNFSSGRVMANGLLRESGAQHPA